MYIDGRPKAVGNIARFINSTRPGSTNKQPNCIFEAREGNRVFVCAIKSITAGEELLIDYNLNRLVTNTITMGVVRTMYHFTQPPINDSNIPFYSYVFFTSLLVSFR